jgi:LysR family glycine cleavage system transcriptional activator
MKWSELPPLNSLRAFAVVAETASFSRAGAALNVSHAAVSQQVKALETRLGVSLFVRERRGIVLTEEGRKLAHDLATGFATIQRGVETLTGENVSRPVQLSTSPAFAVRWLMPRIMEFQARHPDITMMINPTAEVVELKPGGIDMAIRYCDAFRLDEEVTPILVSDMIVAGARSLIGKRKITNPSMLVHMPWLQELGTNEVADWLSRHGVKLDRPLMINHMPGNLIVDGLRRGDGITYTARAFFREEIRSGEIVPLFSEKAVGIYYLKTRPGALRPPLRTFVQWLKKQAETVTEFG